jgi:hypothetical protein
MGWRPTSHYLCLHWLLQSPVKIARKALHETMSLLTSWKSHRWTVGTILRDRYIWIQTSVSCGAHLLCNQGYILPICEAAAACRLGFFIPTDRTEPARSGTGLLVRFGREPAGNRTNSNLNSNHAVQSGPTGIPDRFDRFPVVETKKPN